MSKTWGKFIIVALLIMGIGLSRHVAHAQSSTLERLPSDLVFTSRISLDWETAIPSLTLVDAATLEMSSFYVREDAYQLRVMSWSPQGDVLAVLHIYPNVETVIYPYPDVVYGHPTELCIVTLSGARQTCFQDHPPWLFDTAPFLIDYNYTVTWSIDGQKVYFVAEDTTTGIRRLIEADAVTGETIRALFETEAWNGDGFPTIMIWPPALDYVAAGIGFFERSGSLVHLETGEQHNLSGIVVSWPGGDLRDQPEGAGFVCNSFSPRGTYLTAIDEYDDRLLVFNMELNITHVIDGLGFDGRAKIYCPTWSADEGTFHFVVKDMRDGANHLITYSLAENQITHQIQGTIIAPLEFSPDETHIAFTEPDPRGTYHVRVLCPDGAVWQPGDPFVRTEYPVWRPVQE